MSILIQLKDGRIVTPDEHYEILCEQFGLSGKKSIHRDLDDPNMWYENDDLYEFVRGSENYDGGKILDYLWDVSSAQNEADRILEEGTSK